MVYIGYCFISIINRVLAAKSYSSLVVSVFSRNKFNSFVFLNFYYWFTYFYLVSRLRGISCLISFYNFLLYLVFFYFVVIFDLISLKFYCSFLY